MSIWLSVDSLNNSLPFCGEYSFPDLKVMYLGYKETAITGEKPLEDNDGYNLIVY